MSIIWRQNTQVWNFGRAACHKMAVWKMENEVATCDIWKFVREED
jgi:hypothetical protein